MWARSGGKFFNQDSNGWISVHQNEKFLINNVPIGKINRDMTD